MARYQVQGPDGTMHIIEGPDDAKPADIEAFAAQSIPNAPKESTYLDRLKHNTAALGTEIKDTAMGAVRGAGSIGATLLSPGDAFTRKTGLRLTGNALAPIMPADGDPGDRRQGMTDALGTLGANTDSVGFKGGKILGEVGGTAGAGGLLAQGARGLGAVPEVVNALRTGGFTTGPTARGALDALAIRTLGGAATGGATVGLASPEDAVSGALIGGALPGAAKAVGALGSAAGDAAQGTSKWLMRSALKGTAKMHSRGDVETAVQTLLDYGINPTRGGVEKIKGLVGDLNDKIAAAIEQSDAKIDKNKVLNALASSRERFGKQPAPTKDLATIEGVGADFAKTWPDEIPIQLAQELKQGGNRILRDKYGQLGTAEEAANKDIVRGLKEGVAEGAPEVGPLNAAESKLLTTLKVAERRALMDVNKDPLPLGAVVAAATGHPGGAIAALANSTAYAKSMGARGLNALSKSSPGKLNALAGPYAYRSLPRSEQKN